MEPVSKKAKLLPLAEIAEMWCAQKVEIKADVEKANEDLRKQKGLTFAHRIYEAFASEAISLPQQIRVRVIGKATKAAEACDLARHRKLLTESSSQTQKLLTDTEVYDGLQDESVKEVILASLRVMFLNLGYQCPDYVSYNGQKEWYTIEFTRAAVPTFH